MWRVVEQPRQRQRRGVEELLIGRRLAQQRLDVLDLAAWRAEACKTLALVGSSTQSSRRSTTSGRITRPYSDCL